VGIVGTLVIAVWPYGFVGDTSAILLDMNPNPRIARKLREAVEGRRPTVRSACVAIGTRASWRDRSVTKTKAPNGNMIELD
jgi:hypothetical protein